MFWTTVLPAQITLGILTGIIIVLIYAAPKLKKRRGSVFVWGTLLSILLFIPSCTVVMIITDYFRFGVFHFRDFNAVNDYHVQGDLPEAASEITVEKFPNGHRAKYTIASEELKRWHEQFWKLHDSTIARDQIDLRENIDAADFARWFGHLKWSLPIDAEYYHGPVTARGGGYSIWYSPTEHTAYQNSAYW
jgi:hypothetical protein